MVELFMDARWSGDSMSNVFSIFMPGAAHWEKVKQAEKMLFIDAEQGGEGPKPVDLENGFFVLTDRTGTATQTSTDIGNPNRVRSTADMETDSRTAADDLGALPIIDQQ